MFGKVDNDFGYTTEAISISPTENGQIAAIIDLTPCIDTKGDKDDRKFDVAQADTTDSIQSTMQDIQDDKQKTGDEPVVLHSLLFTEKVVYDAVFSIQFAKKMTKLAK